MARTLHGVRVGVTGARKGADLARALERQGAQAIVGETTAGDMPAEPAEIVARTRTILDAAPAFVACTTGMGVRSWLAATQDDPNLEIAIETMLARSRVVARGAKAVGALRAIGIRPEYVPRRELDVDVVAWLVANVAPGDVVAACLHAQPEDIFDPVRAAGATVLTVAPYRTALPADPAPAVELLQQLCDQRLHVLAFTSPGAVRGLVQIADQHHLLDRVRNQVGTRTAVAAVGVVTAAEVEAAGMPVSIMPTRPRSGALVKEIAWWASPDGGQRTRAFVTLDAGELTATTEERVVPLEPVEYDVLSSLARRPLRDVAADVIATEVWGTPDQTSTLADAIARLRETLAGAVSIEAAPGAGWVLRP